MFTLGEIFRTHRPRIVDDVETARAVPGYPWALIRRIELADGAALRLRPIRPDDEPRLVELFRRLSRRTVYQRFFRAYERLPEHWYHHFANVDYGTRLALVAEEPEANAADAACRRALRAGRDARHDRDRHCRRRRLAASRAGQPSARRPARRAREAQSPRVQSRRPGRQPADAPRVVPSRRYPATRVEPRHPHPRVSAATDARGTAG